MQQDEFRAGSKGTPSKTSKNAKSTKEKHRAKVYRREGKRRQKTKERSATGQKMRSLRAQEKAGSKGGSTVLESACSRTSLGQARRGLHRRLAKMRSRQRKSIGKKVYRREGKKMRSRRWNGQGKSLSGRRKNAKPTDKETIRKVDF